VNQHIDERAQRSLEEAIREIRVIADLDHLGSSTANETSLAVGVTSPDHGDGKTTIAMALAGLLCRDLATHVSLVDADFHTHSIETGYGLLGQRGLSEVLAGSHDLHEVSQPIADTTMQVVPAGHAMDAARIARSDRMGDIVVEMKRQSRYVVLDLPATLRSMNAPALAARCDAVIVVVRGGRTRRADLERTLHLLRGANVVGVVVNHYQSRIPRVVRNAIGITA
jgi:Mrp family chromosome partitioning ATPase